MIDPLAAAALGALAVLAALVLWFRLDVLTRVEFNGEIRVSRRVKPYTMEPSEQTKEDFFSLAERLEKEERDG